MRGMASRPILLIAFLSVLPGIGRGQEVADLAERSTALRTALHYDPELPGRVVELCELYAEAGREEELVEIYESHVDEYPEDRGAACVLLGIYQELGRERQEVWARKLLARFPDDAYVLLLTYESLQDLELLAGAVRRDPDPSRRRQNLLRLLEQAQTEAELALAGETLAEVIADLGPEAETWPTVAAAALDAGLAEETRAWLSAWEKRMENGPTALRLTLLLARAEADLGALEEAAVRLERALGQLDPGQDRRIDVLDRLFDLRKRQGTAGRQLRAFAETAARHPGEVGSILDHAFWLERLGKPAEAATLLRNASLRLPHAHALERKTLELLPEQAVPDYLAAMLEQDPSRVDLRGRLVRALYDQGKTGSARAQWARVKKDLAPEERRLETVRLAEDLEDAGKAREALRLFESALDTKSGDVELRWRAADLRDSLGEPDAADAVLREARPAGLEPDQILAHADRLLDRQLWDAAEAWLESARNEPAAVPAGEWEARRLRLMAARGERSAGERMLAKRRERIDSIQAYRQWLREGIRFARQFGGEGAFLREERGRLEAERREAAWAERFLAWCETAREAGRQGEVIGWLRGRVDEGLEEAEEARSRRLLVEVLGADPAHALEVEAHLNWFLARPQWAQAGDRIRLARVYHIGDRPDLVRAMLQKVAVGDVVDPALLEAGADMAEEYGQTELTGAFLRAWTVVQSSRIEPWEARLRFLRNLGDESAYRAALDACRDASPRSSGEDDRERPWTDRSLRQRWLESALRSFVRGWSRGDRPGLSSLLGGCRRRAIVGEERWIRWLEALLRDENLPDSIRQGDGWIQFPGGWRLRAEKADLALQWARVPDETRGRSTPVLPDRPRLRWVLRPRPDTAWVHARDGGDTILAMDSARSVFAIDKRTGKLRWRRAFRAGGKGFSHGNSGEEGGAFLAREGGIPLLLRSGERLLRIDGDGHLLVEPPDRSTGPAEASRPDLVVSKGCGVVAEEGRLVALELSTGSARWRFRLFRHSQPAERLSSGRPVRASVRMGTPSGGITAYDAGTGLLVALDAVTGKLRWKKELKPGPRRVAFLENQVVTLSGDEPGWEVRDAETGGLVWQGEPAVLEVRPDGTLLSTGERLVASSSGEAEVRLPGLPFASLGRVEVAGAFVGGSGGKLVFCDERGVHLVGERGERSVRIPESGREILGVGLWGDRLLVMQKDGVALWNPHTGRKVEECGWTGRGRESVGFSEGGGVVARWRGDSFVRKEWTPIGPVEISVRPAGAWSPDGWWFLLTDGVLAFWESAPTNSTRSDTP